MHKPFGYMELEFASVDRQACRVLRDFCVVFASAEFRCTLFTYVKTFAKSGASEQDQRVWGSLHETAKTFEILLRYVYVYEPMLAYDT